MVFGWIRFSLLGTLLKSSEGVKTGDNGTSATSLRLFGDALVLNSIVFGISAIFLSLA